jgi:hypothetical protein
MNMNTIYKYEVNPDGRTAMPRDAKILHVGTQQAADGDEGIFVWAIVDTAAPIVQRRLLAVATGAVLHALASTDRYVGSVQFKTESLVFLFDLGMA